MKEQIRAETGALLPNCLVLGAMKAGTTSLYQYLMQHPQIYMSATKEPKFFAHAGQTLNFRGPGDEWTNNNAVTEMFEYGKMFKDAARIPVRGEASALYLYHPQAPARIAHYAPGAKLLVILRHPVDRAFSNYSMKRRFGVEPIGNFEDAIRAEPDRIARNWDPSWHYKSLGFYADQLKRYQAFFSYDQIRVYLYEGLTERPQSLIKDVFQFLGVDDAFIPDLETRHNVTKVARSHKFRAFLGGEHPAKRPVRALTPTRLRRWLVRVLTRLNQYRPSLDPEVRARVSRIYANDIDELQELIGRDLSGWRLD